jgi:hypothetical protein
MNCVSLSHSGRLDRTETIMASIVGGCCLSTDAHAHVDSVALSVHQLRRDREDFATAAISLVLKPRRISCGAANFDEQGEHFKRAQRR